MLNSMYTNNNTSYITLAPGDLFTFLISGSLVLTTLGSRTMISRGRTIIITYRSNQKCKISVQSCVGSQLNKLSQNLSWIILSVKGQKSMILLKEDSWSLHIIKSLRRLTQFFFYSNNIHHKRIESMYSVNIHIPLPYMHKWAQLVR